MDKLHKGKISVIEGELDKNDHPTRARVIPNISPDNVMGPLVIPWYLRGEMGELEVGTEVIFAQFEDGSGMILARADGEWPGVVPGDVEVLGSLVAGTVSLENHVHSGVEPGGGVSGPPQ